MREIVVLSGGVGGARFTRALRDALVDEDARIRVVVNTADDMWMAGLRICPDLDSVTYTLAGVNDEQRGWGRVGETERVSAELHEWGIGWPWFTLGDLDLGMHIARTSLLRDGVPLSGAVSRLTARWDLGVELLPMTDDEVETHVLTDEGSMHFQEWWTRHRAQLPARGFEMRGAGSATPAPGVVEAIESADAVLLAPSNPIVSIGPILAVEGIRQALAATRAPVVGVSPIIGGSVVRGMADACLTAVGTATDAAAVGLRYGARSAGGVLDGWLVDDVDAAEVPELESAGIASRAVPLWMTEPEAARALARDALALASRRG
ncbi:2-phospho-L-lactate transferase [Demequina zhanjiangensis]|uniref:2-phospho-L-lactate transferase n=1 Tax=Demequina zhanjiangensis TaxID=3051659 RepID=A0ABT8FXH7_9MICO|nr:2-phospho-L-lactate transferase [Demequina sp. SYSU T00b26]MDN4471498.1 2-phospho-L-lactate transferase [Demequina sp. SYSU T00b26]